MRHPHVMGDAMDERWPDPNVGYEFAGSVPGAQALWQQALDEALKAKSLELYAVSDDVYNLHGSCPRCSHPMANSLEFTLVLPGGGLRAGSDHAVTQGTFDVVCDCRGVHDGRPEEKKKGCGWGAGIGVTIRKPERTVEE